MHTTDTPAPVRNDAYVIALVGFAHGVSHFFHLLLPTLFPWLMPAFGLDFVAIGSTMTLFFVVSGVGQASAGLAVDRFGPVRVLAAGIACFVGAGAVLAQATSFFELMLVAALAGAGNSVFHPCDFTILNRNVSQPRLGHAFSVHGLSGNLGWAAAPLFMTGIAAFAGWRFAALAAGLLALPALALIIAGRDHLVDEARAAAPDGRRVSTLEILRVTPVWMCFGFFFLLTLAFGAFQNFGAPLMRGLYDMSVAGAAAALSTYLLGGAGGILVGGFLTRSARQDQVILWALLAAAATVLLLASGRVPADAAVPAMAAIGFFTGLAGPSRDLLVRRAATARFGQAAFGRVYGFVYSGLDAGLALAPLVFGGLMDAGRFGTVLAGIAALQVAAIATAVSVERV